jgi:hypothetical protein
VEHFLATGDDNPGGYVTFQPGDDKVELCDSQADGASVELDVWNVTKDPDVYEYGMSESHADLSCNIVNAAMGQPYNLAEDHCFRFRIRLRKNGNIISGTTNSAQWRNYNNTRDTCPGVD